LELGILTISAVTSFSTGGLIILVVGS